MGSFTSKSTVSTAPNESKDDTSRNSSAEVPGKSKDD